MKSDLYVKTSSKHNFILYTFNFSANNAAEQHQDIETFQN